MPLAISVTWAHCWLMFSQMQHLQILFHQAAFQTFCPKPVTLCVFIMAQEQNTELCLVEPHKIGLGPSIHPLQISLHSLPALQEINTSRQYDLVCELTGAVLTVRIIDKVIKQNWPYTQPQGTALVQRLNSIYHNFLDVDIQTVIQKRAHPSNL